MYHHYDAVLNSKSGVPTADVIIRAFAVADDSIAPLFADESGTPIETASGIPNAAKSNADGNYDFFIADGFYNLRFYIGDALIQTIRNIQMKNSASQDDLAAVAAQLPAAITDPAFSPPGTANYTPSMTAMFAAAAAFLIPAGSYALASTPVMPEAGFSWRKDVGAQFTGAGTLLDPVNFPGFSYTADLRHIQVAEFGGSAAAPSTVSHPVAFISQHTAAAGSVNPAAVFQQNKWSAVSQTGAQGGFFETIDRAGNGAGRTDFVEGIRSHGVGIGAAGYGAILVGQVGDGGASPNGKYAVGAEMEVIRTSGASAVLPTTWTVSNNFDAAVLATVRYGVKAMAGFAVNPFNEVRANVGFGVFNTFAAQGIARRSIDFASFFSNENDVPYGLFLRNIGFASISTDNNKPFVSLNAAGNAELNMMYCGIDNAVHIGQGTTGVALYGPMTFKAETGLVSIIADTSPLDYSNSRARFAYQHRDIATGATNELIPGAVFQFNVTGNGTVNAGIELSQTIWSGQFNYMSKTGDGSAHTFTSIGELGAYGAGGYNELGMFQGEATNTGSALGTISGVEMLIKDSPDGGTTSFSTKMQGVVSRIAKYNGTARKSHSFYASCEGSQPIHAVIGVNPGGLASWVRGFDFEGAVFTSGQFGLAPNNTFLGWLRTDGSPASVVGINNANEVFLAAASAVSRVNLTTNTFATRLAIDSDATNAVLLWMDGAEHRVLIGANDSGGAGFRMMRVAN